MSEQEVVQPSTSDDISQVEVVEVKDAPATTEQAKVETVEETPAETVTLTKEELQAQKNAIAKKEREKAERKSQREIQALRAEFEALKAPQKETFAVTGEPTLDQFETFDEYTKAFIRWEMGQANQEREKKAREEESSRQRTKMQTTFAEKTDKFREETPDYDDVIADIADVELSEAIAVSVLESDLAAQLTYYFGKHPDELDRINSLSPLATAREIGKLEAKLSSEPKKQLKQSDAPAPIAPVGTSKATVTPDFTKMTDEEWDRYEREQRYKKG